MKKIKTRKSLFLLVLLVLVCANSLYADWSDDPANPTPISTADNFKLFPQLTETTDGYVVAWGDQRRGPVEYYPYPYFTDLYTQKFTADGEMQWAADGRVVAEGPAGELLGITQTYHSLVSDNAGGATIQWTDAFGAFGNTYITQVTGDQSVQWGLPGVAIQADDSAVQIEGTGASTTQFLLPDTEGGVFSVIEINSYPHVVRYSADGEQRTGAWVGDRYLVSAASGNDDSVIVASISYLGATGVYLIKVRDPEENWPNELDNLETEWAVYQPALVPYAGDAAKIISDGAGGAFVVWRVEGELGSVSVQKVNADGSFAWGENGVSLRMEPGEGNRFPCLIPDGEGGIVVFWENLMPWETRIIRAQRVNAMGVPQWADGGVVISNAATDGRSPQAILSSEGNYIIVFNQQPYDLVAQKLDDDGTFLWGDDGKKLSTTFMLSDWEKAFDIVSDKQGGVIAAFTARVGTDLVDKIYAARIHEELPDLPDLTISRVTASSYWWGSKQITARVTVSNIGAADIPADQNCQVSLYLDDVNTTPVATEILNGGLAVDDTNILRMQFSAPSIAVPGSYNLIVVVDSDEQIAEEDEENNEYTKVIKY